MKIKGKSVTYSGDSEEPRQDERQLVQQGRRRLPLYNSYEKYEKCDHNQLSTLRD